MSVLVYNGKRTIPERIINRLLVSDRHLLSGGSVRRKFERLWLNRYAKYYMIHPAKLRLVGIECIDACNNNCWFCPNHKLKRTGNKMSWGTFTRLIEQLKGFDGILSYAFRSEPTLYPELLEMTRYASKRLPDCQIHYLTNGKVLEYSTVKDLLSSPNVWLFVDTYGKQNVLEKVNRYPANDRLAIWTNKRPQNITNFADPEATRFKLPLRQFCAWPFHEIAIRWDGSTRCCCCDWSDEEAFGNINKTTINEIWNGEAMKIKRQELLENRRTGVCAQCDYFGEVDL